MVMIVFEQIKTFTPVKFFLSVSMQLNPRALWKETRISVMFLAIFTRTRGGERWDREREKQRGRLKESAEAARLEIGGVILFSERTEHFTSA